MNIRSQRIPTRPGPRIAGVLAVAVAVFGVAGSTRAATVETPLFTVQVPDGWTIEDNQSSIVLVMGERIRDRTPMPFLSIQYCSTAEPAEDSWLRACQNACSEEALALPEEADGLKLSAVEKQSGQDGQVQFRRHAVAPRDVAAFTALSCGSIGQVYLSLVSDESSSEARRMFDEILASLRWKQSLTAD